MELAGTLVTVEGEEAVGPQGQTVVVRVTVEVTAGAEEPMAETPTGLEELGVEVGTLMGMTEGVEVEAG